MNCFYFCLFIIFYFNISSIIASGASGARGRDNKASSQADQIRALIRLEANETIFILVTINDFKQSKEIIENKYDKRA
jgi:hypothetical protein